MIDSRSAESDAAGLGRMMAGLFLFTLLAHMAGHLASPALGGFADGDGYLRVMRVEQWLRTGDWFDVSIPRLNAPYGDISHWTRPLDVLIAVLSAPLIPVLGLREAVYWGGAISNPLLHAGTTVTMVWAAFPLVGRQAAILAAIVSIAQPAVFIYSGPDRADHHALLIFLTAIALGFMLRALDPRYSSPKWALGAGITCAASIWVGIEATVLLALCLAGLGLAWAVGQDDPGAGKLFMFTRGLAGGLIAAILMERGPSGFGAVEYDRLSIVHVGIGVFALGGIGLMRLIGRVRPEGRTAEKLIVGTVCASAALGAWLWVFPDAIHGPMAKVAPEVKTLVYGLIREYESGFTPELFPSLLGGALLALPYLVWRFSESLADRRRWGWLFLLLCILVYGSLSVAWIRWSVYIGLFPCVVLGEAIQRWVARIQRMDISRIGREAAAAAVVVAVIVGPLGAASLAAWVFGRDDPAIQGKRNLCRTELLADLLNRPPWSDRSRIVLTNAGCGPELVYRTPHRAVGSLYHRNTMGLVDTMRIFAAKDDAVARDIIERRGIDMIVICPPVGNDGASPKSLESGALYQRLRDGKTPVWLKQREAAAPAVAFQIYEVVSGEGRR